MNRSRTQLKRVLLAMTALAIARPVPLFACAVCFGDPQAPMTKGLTWGIVALAGFIATVLGGVVVFFVHVGRTTSQLKPRTAEAPTPDSKS